MSTRNDKADSLQPISDSLTYPLPAFLKVTGWGRHSLRIAREQGLKVVKVSGRCYVRGCDFSEWIGRLSTADATGEASQQDSQQSPVQSSI